MIVTMSIILVDPNFSEYMYLLVQNVLLTWVLESGMLFLKNLIAMFRFHYSSEI